jgi:hypothetical protein
MALPSQTSQSLATLFDLHGVVYAKLQHLLVGYDGWLEKRTKALMTEFCDVCDGEVLIYLVSNVTC